MTLQEANKFLDDTYGRRDPLYPRFRIVLSGEIHEKQVVYDTYYTDDGQPISEGNRRVELCPKYPWITGNKFIFEVHCPTEHPDIVDHAGNYEPSYIFEDKDGNALPLDRDMIQLWAKGLSEHVVPKTPGQLQSEYEAKMEKAKELEFQMLDDAVPYIPSLMKMGEGVFVDSTKRYGND